MNWFYYLNYKLFKFYNRKKDSVPVFSAGLLASLLIYLNIFTAISIYSIFQPIDFLNKENALIFGTLIAIVNYLILYRNKKYEDVFDFFDKNFEKYEKWNISINIYIIGTILSTFMMLIIVQYLV